VNSCAPQRISWKRSNAPAPHSRMLSPCDTLHWFAVAYPAVAYHQDDSRPPYLPGGKRTAASPLLQGLALLIGQLNSRVHARRKPSLNRPGIAGGRLI
jgi:hypothetical protein